MISYSTVSPRIDSLVENGIERPFYGFQAATGTTKSVMAANFAKAWDNIDLTLYCPDIVT